MRGFDFKSCFRFRQQLAARKTKINTVACRRNPIISAKDY